MTALFLGVQKAGKGNGEVAVAVVDGVHGPDHERLSAFLRKQGKLGGLMPQIGQPNPEKPHRLLKLDRIQDIDRRLVDVIALADGGCQGLLFAEAGIKIGIPDIKADGFAGNAVAPGTPAHHFGQLEQVFENILAPGNIPAQRHGVSDGFDPVLITGRNHWAVVNTKAHIMQMLSCDAELSFQDINRKPSQIPDGSDSQKIQMAIHSGTDTAKILDWQWIYYLRYFIRTNDRQPIRLFHIAGKFGKKLVGTDADRTRQTGLLQQISLARN